MKAGVYKHSQETIAKFRAKIWRKLHRENHQKAVKISNAKKRKPVVLCGCGKPVSKRLYTRCHSCAMRSFSGSKNPAWRGGSTSKEMLVRTSKQYKIWRESVLRRDNRMCVFCSKEGPIMHVDHIKPFAEHPELRLDISNGRTLCISCHRKRHAKSN